MHSQSASERSRGQRRFCPLITILCFIIFPNFSFDEMYIDTDTDTDAYADTLILDLAVLAAVVSLLFAHGRTHSSVFLAAMEAIEYLARDDATRTRFRETLICEGECDTGTPFNMS